MVFIKETALRDLDIIREGLLKWNKIILTSDFVHSYINRLIDSCFQIETEMFKTLAKYSSHLLFGQYVYKHKANYRTTWYIIYNIDSMNNILIERIISNYVTVE